MKKIVALIMTGVMMVSLGACSSDGDSEKSKSSSIDVLDCAIDYVSIDGKKIYLSNDLDDFTKQFNGLHYVCKTDSVSAGYSVTYLDSADSNFYSSIADLKDGEAHIETDSEADFGEKHYPNYPDFSFRIGDSTSVTDESGKIVPKYWSLVVAYGGDITKISIKGNELDFEDGATSIDEIIKILGDDYDYEEEDLSSKKAYYTWKDGKYEYEFRVEIEDENDYDYNCLEAVHIFVEQ